MRKITLIVSLILCTTFLFSQTSTNYKIKNSVFDQGGSACLSSNYKIVCAIGQTGTIGNSSNPTMLLSSGFINQNLISSFFRVRSEVATAAGWNLMSIPLILDNMEVSTIFPSAASNAYSYNNGYSIANSLVNGSGYWLKFGNGVSPSVEVTGIKPTQNINLSSGWNIIGLYERNIAVTNITTVPAGIITSNFFGYSNGYIIPDTLKSGKGYWIKANQAGVIDIAGSYIAKENIASNEIGSSWSSIELTDAGGKEGILYFTDKESDIAGFELPPIPPNGIFDFRFTTDRLVEELNSGMKEIKISSAEYPIKLKAVGTELKITDLLGGKIVNKVIKPGESITINNSAIEILSVERITVPDQFKLYQNYPNPFNPATTIKYSLPQAMNVTIKIYDVLGREVITLVNGNKDAGNYEVEFHASNLSSGIYFYRLKTDRYTEIKKMILSK